MNRLIEHEKFKSAARKMLMQKQQIEDAVRSNPAIDAADAVLRPAILWNDQRTAARVRPDPRQTVGRERLIAITGNDALPGFTAPKLLWVREHEPDIWHRIAHILLPKDFVRLRLTGEHAIDKADGAGTMLFDLAARDWSTEVVDALGSTGVAPADARGAGDHRYASRAAAAAATGLRAGRRSWPVEAIRPRTRWASACRAGRGVAVARHVGRRVRRRTDEPLFEPEGRVHAFCHAVPERWHMMWRDAVGGGQPALVPRRARAGRRVRRPRRRRRRGPAGSDGLLFLPTSPASGAPIPIRSRAARSSG